MDDERRQVFVGIDGGGTSSRLMVTDGEGHGLVESRSGPANALVVGWDRAKSSLDVLREQCQRGEWHLAGLVAGLAGSDRLAVRQGWLKYFQDWPVDKLWLTGDYRIAWAALTHGRPGLITIVGTGSIVYAEDGVRTVRRGGYGWKFGDVGSGIWLGTEAAKAALAQWEGWGEPTALAEVVAERYHVAGTAALLEYWYGPLFDQRAAADLAPEVVALAAQDSSAHRIVAGAARGLTALMLSAIDDLDWQQSRVGVTGGLAPRLMPWLEREWWSRGRTEPLHHVNAEPVEGAAILARLWVSQERVADGGTG